MDAIHFYRERDLYGELSNFARFPVEIAGRVWPTPGHYFQAMKVAGTPDEERVRQARSPGEAKRLARSLPLRPDWERVKEEVMRAALRAKLTQHARARRLLLGTGEALLVEHTSRDAHWGDGGDGSGRNRLGVLLMEVREELRASG